jgi:putative ABC transport system permease protein
MARLLQDARDAVRRLARTPGFTLVCLVSLALAIGANTALFSVVHAVLLKPLPFARPDGLYFVWSRHTSTDRYPFSLPEFCDYRDRNQTLEAFAGFANWSGSLAGEATTERIPGLRVSDDFFEMLGAAAALGRTLLPGDDRPGHEKVVVLSHGLWQRRFGGDPGLLGRPISLNGESFTVVGVLGRSFLFPVADIELAIPLAPDQDPWRHNRESTNFIRAIARARTGADRERITADLDAVGRRLQQEFPDSYARKRGVLVVPYREALTGNFSRALWLLMAAVALLMLIACANLANLMLVRATARRQEMAVRVALGARPALLMRDLLAESAIVALVGAALGSLLAHVAVPVLAALSPTAMPRSQEIHVSLPVLLFTLGAALLSGLGFGLAPAWRATRGDLIRELRSGGAGAAGDADHSRARGLIVVAQVAVMVVLLTVTALLLRSFQAVMGIEPGFDQRLLSVRMSLPRAQYDETRKLSRFYEELEARLKRLPGVIEVAAANQLPLNGAIASADYRVEDRPPSSDDQLPTALYRMVTPRYFQAMGIPLIAGRALGEGDREGMAAVAVISQALARLSFPDRDPVGRHLLVKDNPDGFRPMEIVGVVGDVKHASLEAASEPHLYVPYHQTNRSLLVWLAQTQFLVVSTEGDPLSLASTVRREIQVVDPSVASAGGRLTGDYVEAAAAARRFSVVLLGLFAGIALLMAAVGIYGVVAYAVARRTRETGLRLALGATRSDILILVLGQGLKRTVLGCGAGLIAAFLVARSLGTLLFGVGVADLSSYAGVVALLMAVTLFACMLPAWRAARLEPVRALRDY